MQSSAEDVMTAPKVIPEAFLKRYADECRDMANQLPEGPMRDALLQRAEHVMDVVTAFRDATR